jgi:hypothetical protein
MTRRKKQVNALRGTAVAWDQASEERFSEITSGTSRWQQGLIATCKDSSNEAQGRRRGEPEGMGALECTALLHHLTIDLLRESFYSLKRKAAPGVDGVTWQEYENGIEDRLIDLHGRVHRGAYRAQPSRRVYIEKEDGRQREGGVNEGHMIDKGRGKSSDFGLSQALANPPSQKAAIPSFILCGLSPRVSPIRPLVHGTF